MRDGSIDSREGSVSPTRRRKKARRMSEGAEPASNSNGCSNEPHCKEETARDGVEDLTLDEEPEEPPAHNDVVRSESLYTIARFRPQRVPDAEREAGTQIKVFSFPITFVLSIVLHWDREWHLQQLTASVNMRTGLSVPAITVKQLISR